MRPAWTWNAARLSPVCGEIIRRNHAFPYASYPEPVRFQIALDMSVAQIDQPESILKWAGLTKITQRFVTSSGRNGATILHKTAGILGYQVHRGFGLRDRRMQSWIAFTKDLLNNGANPSSSEPDTPLVHLVEVPCLYVIEFSDYVDFLVKGFRLWINILVGAGVDLSAYGAREDELWDQKYPQGLLLGSACVVLRPIFDTRNPSACGVEIRRSQTLKVYELQSTPGAWPSKVCTTLTISWEPDHSEQDEGTWALKSSRTLVSDVLDTQRLISDWDRTTPHLLMDCAQDDCGFIATRVNRRKQACPEQRRASSQPPALSRRALGHDRHVRSQLHQWLPGVHLCPYDMRLRFDCRSETNYGLYYSRFSVLRYCVQGGSMVESCVQETSLWSYRSWESEVDETSGLQYREIVHQRLRAA